MNRLIKAEWYRVSKTYRLLFWTVVLCVFFTYIGWMQIDADISTGDLALGEYMEFGSMILMYMAMLVGGMYVTAYENKMLNYEIMAGNKISHILLSKTVIVTPILTAVVTALAGFIYVYFGETNGYGEMGDMAIRFVLYGLLAARVCLCAIFIMTTFKSVIGMFVVFIRFMALEGVGIMIVALLFEDSDNLSAAACALVSGQTTVLGTSPMTSSIVVACIVSGIVETILWYVLSYNSYKKKLFS